MLTGTVELDVFDSTGKRKKHLVKHNSITQLGKMAALTRGVAGLFDYCQQYGQGVQKVTDTGDYSYSGTTQKPSTGIVTCRLTSKSAADFAYRSHISLTDAETLGYCGSEVATSADAKQGIRQNARDAQGNMIVGNANREAARYSWTGIEGNLNTIAMFIPPLSIRHLADSYGSDSSDKTTVDPGIIVSGDAGVTGEKIAIGAYQDILLNLSDLSMGDFIPGTPSVTTYTHTGRCGFAFGDYIITFTPYANGDPQQFGITPQPITVYNKTNNTFYTQSIPSGTYVVRGFFVKNNALYFCASSKVFSCAIDDTAITFTEVTASSYIDSSWISDSYGLVPIQFGATYETYVIASGTDHFTSCYIMPDMLLTANDRYLAPWAGNKSYYTYAGARGGVYLNCIYSIETEGLWLTPAGQWGNLFSYFDLEETVEITTADTVQLTYYYQLEDPQ